MNILLTNDDGLHFPGVTILRDSLKDLGNVYICAPSSEKSGTSQAITIYDPVYVKEHNEREFLIEGFPVDCVNIGLHGDIIADKIDLVISGINKGVNMGEDTWYSGTVGAARHAYIHGISAIAISCGYLDSNGNYEKIADFVKDFIESPYMSIEKPTLFNINYPVEKPIAGTKLTKLGRRIYRDSYKKTSLKDGGFLFDLGGSQLSHQPVTMSDFEAYANGYVSVTPLTTDATDYETLKNIDKDSGW